MGNKTTKVFLYENEHFIYERYQAFGNHYVYFTMFDTTIRIVYRSDCKSQFLQQMKEKISKIMDEANKQMLDKNLLKDVADELSFQNGVYYDNLTIDHCVHIIAYIINEHKPLKMQIG